MSIGAANKRQYQRIALWQWVELNPNVEHGNKGGGGRLSVTTLRVNVCLVVIVQ